VLVLKLFRSENLETATCKRARSVMRLDISKLIFKELAELIRYQTECLFCVFYLIIYLPSFFYGNLSACNKLQLSVPCHAEFNVFMCMHVSVIILGYNMVEILGEFFPEINTRG